MKYFILMMVCLNVKGEQLEFHVMNNLYKEEATCEANRVKALGELKPKCRNFGAKCEAKVPQ